MQGNIDYDRGLIKRIHPTGVEVYMYRDTPGVYLNAHGVEVSESLAETAGFPVKRYELARRKMQMVSKALETIEAELSGDETTARTVILERDGFNLVSIGLGRHIIEDPDGNNLTPNPLTREEGDILFNQMAPEKEKGEDGPEKERGVVDETDATPTDEVEPEKKKD